MFKVKATALRGVIIAALSLTAVQSFASPTVLQAPATANVRYDDLNVADKKDAVVLYGRLQVATKQVCAPYAAARANPPVAQRSCYKKVLAQAVQDVNAAEVTQLHAKTMGGKSSDQYLAGGSAGRLAK